MANPDHSLESSSAFPIYIVDDETTCLQSMEMILRYAGLEPVVPLSRSEDLLPSLRKTGADLIILDIRMPVIRGDELLVLLTDEFPDIPVVMVTAINDVQEAVDCLRNGACDYFLKPLERSRFIARVRHLLSQRELLRENRSLARSLLSSELSNPDAFTGIVYSSDKIHKILKYLEAIASSSFPVLITGETGVGKELFAQAIHRVSNRPGKCVSINVAGIDDHMFSDTLFGHISGAFTGAQSGRAGLVHTASRGTLFLDEIGDLSQTSQIKLLRLIQEREYYPVGSDLPRKLEARIVTSTCRSVQELRNGSNFRKDLYYRLFTHHIHIPPLRERREDIPALARRFISRGRKVTGSELDSLPHRMMNFFQCYDFPGNVRELESLIIDVLSMSRGNQIAIEEIARRMEDRILEIEGGQLRSDSCRAEDGPDSLPGLSAEVPKHFQEKKSLMELLREIESLPGLKESEGLLIMEAMRRSGGKLTEAAGLLGISRQALGQRMKRLSERV